MEIDESGWHDLHHRLGALDMPEEQQEVLLAHLTARLVGHFGTDSFECHLGKNDPRRHAMREVAAAALAHLAPVLDLVPVGALESLIESEGLGAPAPPPWNDHWRDQPRTASWRS